MPSSQYHYLPLAPAFFSLLVGVLVVVVVLIQLGILISECTTWYLSSSIGQGP